MPMRTRSVVVVSIVYLAILSPLFAQTGIPGSGQRLPLGDVGKLPNDWSPGKFDPRADQWLPGSARNIKWVADLGSQTFGAPIVADGRVYVGTNNGYRKGRGKPELDLGRLMCFRESDGQLLWQHASDKLGQHRHDWPLQGIQCSPWVEGDRAWFVNGRGEVICLDTQGFADGQDDGEPFVDASWLITNPDIGSGELTAQLNRQQFTKNLEDFLDARWRITTADYRLEVLKLGESWRIVGRQPESTPSFSVSWDASGLRIVRENAKPGPHDADVVWKFDMMRKLGTRQHMNTTCCVRVWRDTLFVCTGNGVGPDHQTMPAPSAPSFIALDKTNSKILWMSNLPGSHVHHGNWSSPAVGILGGVPQVIFNGGDGWTYSFHAEEWEGTEPQLLWKFDTNAKNTVLDLGGRGTRCEPIGAPVLHEDRVYITTGQDPEHGEGPACIWCIDPTKRGDISADLLVLKADRKSIVPQDKNRHLHEEPGIIAIPNPNSAVVWKYIGYDLNADGNLEHEEEMHRTLSPVVIDGELLFATDFAGFVHCLDRKTGHRYWGYDALAAIWSPAFVADGKVYITDEDGDVAIFRASADPAVAGQRGVPLAEKSGPAWIDPRQEEINMVNSCYTAPTASKGVLFIANKDHLFAIEEKKARNHTP